MTKPTGAICNLDCHYCCFLSKEMMYPGSRFRMAETLLETFVKQTIESQPVPEITFTWQGGEPTLMGLEFFKRVIDYQKRHTRPGLTIHNALQTNGTLLDDDWCRFSRRTTSSLASASMGRRHGTTPTGSTKAARAALPR